MTTPTSACARTLTMGPPRCTTTRRSSTRAWHRRQSFRRRRGSSSGRRYREHVRCWLWLIDSDTEQPEKMDQFVVEDNAKDLGPEADGEHSPWSRSSPSCRRTIGGSRMAPSPSSRTATSTSWAQLDFGMDDEQRDLPQCQVRPRRRARLGLCAPGFAPDVWEVQAVWSRR